MFQYSFSKSKSLYCTLLIVSYFRRKVSVPARGTSVTNLISISYTLFVVFLHLAPLQGGKDAAFGKRRKAGEGGLGF